MVDNGERECYNRHINKEKGGRAKMDIFFSGKYEHQLDSKRRIRIPSKLKAQLGENYAITIGNDHCLWILPFQTMEALKRSLESLDTKDPKSRAAKRLVLEQMYSPEEDNQGRLVLPKDLISYASIDKDLLFIGQDKYIEIWAKESYEKFMSEFTDLDISQYVDINISI